MQFGNSTTTADDDAAAGVAAGGGGAKTIVVFLAINWKDDQCNQNDSSSVLTVVGFSALLISFCKSQYLIFSCFIKHYN